MANLDYISHQTLVDANGVPYAGAKLLYSETGGPTPKATYSDAGLSSPNTDPVVCDANGVVPEVYLLAGRYRRTVTTSANVSLPQFYVDPLDASVEMIVSASPPSPAYPFLEYTDGTSRFRRNAANTAWINMGLVDSVVSGATVSEQLVGTSTSVSATPDSVAALWQRGTDIASAATISLPATGGRHFNITGTTTCTAISSAQGGRTVELKFAGACQLTHNGTSFILLDGVNETTFAGNVYEFTNEAATDASGSNWRCTKRIIAAGPPAAKTASYTVLDTDRNAVIRFSGLAADATLTLPAAANRAGFEFTVVNENVFADNVANTTPFGVVFDPNAAEFIDGLATRKTFAFSRITVICDGTGWRTKSGMWRYFSGNQTITLASQLVLAHGLGVRPTRVWHSYQNITAELGYTQYDIVDTNAQTDAGASACGHAVVWDGTNITVRIGTISTLVLNKTTGAAAAMTVANWRIQFHAEA